MHHGVSPFDEWLHKAQVGTRDLELVPALNAVARHATVAFGAQLWFAAIFGRRWSCIAGQAPQQPVAEAPSRVALTGGIGVVSACWGSLSRGECARLVGFLERLIESKQRPTGS